MKTVLVILTFILLPHLIFSQNHPPSSKMENQTNHLQFEELYFVVVTQKLAETKAFYEKLFGFKALFESSWFYYLQSPGEAPFGLAIMDENHPTHPPSLPGFQPQSGIFMTLRVSDAQAEFQKLKSLGVKPVYDLKSEPWGQKRFCVQDPNGLFIDIVEQTEPQKGWWDAYVK